MRLVLVVAAALIDADGRVLLAQRPKGKALEGLWEFPGGKVDAGEGPEDALIRELMEELGITVKADCLAPLTFASHAYPDFHLMMPLLIAQNSCDAVRSFAITLRSAGVGFSPSDHLAQLAFGGPP